MCVAFLPVAYLVLTHNTFLINTFYRTTSLHRYPCQGPALSGTGMTVRYLLTMVKHYGKCTWYEYCPACTTIIPLSCMAALYVRSIPTCNYYRYLLHDQYVPVLTDPW